MGFLKRLFSGDPQRDLERAETLLEGGESEKALELARKARARVPATDRDRADALVEKVRGAVATMAIEKASLAESSEYFEDAVEWLDVALEHVGDEARRGQLETLRASLLERAREAREEAWEPQESESEPQTELDPGAHYQALTDMLVEEVAERYEAQLPPFRLAYVALNEGRVAEAHSTFEALEPSADEAVFRLERGRCRLAIGDADGALSDLEAVWPSFGDQPLDLAGELSVPGLWAEAMLALDRPAGVIERLGPLADPIAAAPVAERYGQALLEAEHFDEARTFLAAAAAGNGARPLFPYLLAKALASLGERSSAIDCLETAIAPSCVTGCAPKARHIPSFRALASLYLDEETEPDRVRQLMTLVAQTLGGRLAGTDHLLLARYYDQIGDAEAAGHARDHARELEAAAESGTLEAVPSAPAMGAQRRAPL